MGQPFGMIHRFVSREVTSSTSTEPSSSAPHTESELLVSPLVASWGLLRSSDAIYGYVIIKGAITCETCHCGKRSLGLW
jgi:hypothetical protein